MNIEEISDNEDISKWIRIKLLVFGAGGIGKVINKEKLQTTNSST